MVKYDIINGIIYINIDDFLLFTTTKEVINKFILEKKQSYNNIYNLPYLSKEKTNSLISILSLYLHIFINKTILIGEQVHGNNVIYANQQEQYIESYSDTIRINNFNINYTIFPKTDGIISNNKQDVIVIFTADCIPLFVIDRQNKWFSLVHVGRKGIQNNILENLFKKIYSSLATFSLNDTFFIVGPHICENCYYVDGEKYSLVGELYKQLSNFGIKHNQIVNLQICTYHQEEYQLFSYRKDATQYRNVSVITRA
jgi:copper oxidase (laccase) domain-containing protein